MRDIVVYIADDHGLLRSALANTLRTFDRVQLVDEASNGQELLRLIKKRQPDVVVLDLEMPIMNGLVACEKIAHHYPEVKVLILSMHDGDGNILKLLTLGAHAFLGKDTTPEEFKHAVYSLVDVGVYRNERMTKILKKELPRHFKTSFEREGRFVLTTREEQILRLVASQLTVRQMAGNLGLSEYTVRNHKVRLMRKINVKNSAGLICYAAENGYLN